jgi:hypothetical protein
LKLVVVATVLLMAAHGWAQDAPAAGSQDEGGAEAARSSQSDYGGPSLLSRGGAPSVLRGGETTHLVPFLSATGIYDTGMGGSFVNEQGQVVYRDAYGEEGTFGLTGTHKWAHSVLDVDYRGMYRNYTNYSQFNGLDNSLDISLQNQVTARLGITLTEDLGRTRSPYSLPMGSLYGGGMVGYNPVYNALTADSVLDTPTLASVSSVRLVYQYSARLSVSVGGTGIVSRQHAQQTLGVDGYIGTADLAYRLSRYQTIAFNYSYTHLGYLGGLGYANIHGAGISYSARIGRYWEASLSGGASRLRSFRNQAVALDPVFAQLLGQSVVFVQSHDLIYVPYASARLTRSFRHSSWTAGYDRNTMAGNGLYATSTHEDADTSFSYTGLRRLSLQAGASYNRISALTQTIGAFRSYSASAGFGLNLAKGFSIIGRLDGRRYRVADSSLDRTSYRATLGIAWHPGEYPLALW